jgi:FkbM family methyltransferase
MSLDFRNALYHGNYERVEMSALQATLEPGDIVMEFGTGIGFLSAYAARVVGSERVTTYEANFQMKPLIERTYALNGVQPTSKIALVATHRGEERFHVGARFYESSSTRKDPSSEGVIVPTVSVTDELRTVSPTYLIMDVEGSERELIPAMDLSRVNKLLIEVHPDIIGVREVRALYETLISQGFALIRELSVGQQWFLGRVNKPLVDSPLT